MVNPLENKSIFFGPFIGEFGWELHSWSGWINTVCEKYFRDNFTVAASYPGRQVLYKSVDKFISHPKWWIDLPKVQRNYILDFWADGFPRESMEDLEKSVQRQDMCILADKLLDYYLARLPKDVTVFCPFRLNHFYVENLVFGIQFGRPVTRNSDLEVFPIPYSAQNVVKLSSTVTGREALTRILRNGKKQIVALFPRFRVARPFLNWGEENYRRLVFRLQEAGFVVAMLGEPGGCYFGGGVPPDVVDLINIDSEARTDVHIACLELASFALGAFSGSIHFALAAGCPTLTWGHSRSQLKAYVRNPLKTRHYYYPFAQCSVDDLWRQMQAFQNSLSVGQMRQRVSQEWCEFLSVHPQIRGCWGAFRRRLIPNTHVTRCL